MSQESLALSSTDRFLCPKPPDLPNTLLKSGSSGRALFSTDERHRYWLDRWWGGRGGGALAFCMLNPSTATHEVLDPTLTRCKSYAQAWGYDGMVVVNLFSLRSTDPDGLRHDPDPAGGYNNRAAILSAGKQCGEVVAGWGSFPLAIGLSDEVATELEMIGAKITCLGHTKSGAPRHPLYLKANALRRPARQPAA